jgi:hypothetical protein
MPHACRSARQFRADICPLATRGGSTGQPRGRPGRKGLDPWSIPEGSGGKGGAGEDRVAGQLEFADGLVAVGQVVQGHTRYP